MRAIRRTGGNGAKNAKGFVGRATNQKDELKSSFGFGAFYQEWATLFLLGLVLFCFGRTQTTEMGYGGHSMKSDIDFT